MVSVVLGLGVGLVSLWMAFPVFQWAYFRVGYGRLCRRWRSLWARLDRAGKAQWHFANQGRLLAHLYQDVDSTLARIERRYGALGRDLWREEELTTLREFCRSCPDYDALDEVELDREFRDELREQWEAMVRSSDYDLWVVEREMNYVFEWRRPLSEFMRERRPRDVKAVSESKSPPAPSAG